MWRHKVERDAALDSFCVWVCTGAEEQLDRELSTLLCCNVKRSDVPWAPGVHIETMVKKQGHHGQVPVAHGCV